jgi:spore coat polysaccharide biosynthesis protein SpsF
MSLGIVIQARMGSTRLPGKVLRPIAGRPLLSHVTGRLALLRAQAKAVVATSTLAQDDAIEAWCKGSGVACFRGDEQDVLDRYLRCAEAFGFGLIVRLTADNPFTDIVELDRLIDLQASAGLDYAHSFGMMPIGVGAEIFTLNALRCSHREGLAAHHREHVNEYMQEHPEIFRSAALDIPLAKRAPRLRLTVDTEEDWQRADMLAAHAGHLWLDTEKAMALCSRSA